MEQKCRFTQKAATMDPDHAESSSALGRPSRPQPLHPIDGVNNGPLAAHWWIIGRSSDRSIFSKNGNPAIQRPPPPPLKCHVIYANESTCCVAERLIKPHCIFFHPFERDLQFQTNFSNFLFENSSRFQSIFIKVLGFQLRDEQKGRENKRRKTITNFLLPFPLQVERERAKKRPKNETVAVVAVATRFAPWERTQPLSYFIISLLFLCSL